VTDPKHSLFNQLVRITRDRGALAHNDRLDALAIGVGYWVDQMAQDTNKAVDRDREKLREAELKRFMQGCFGNRWKVRPTWMALSK
jgi:hypothetical protein